VSHHIDYDKDNDNERDPGSAFDGDNPASSVCGDAWLAMQQQTPL